MMLPNATFVLSPFSYIQDLQLFPCGANINKEALKKGVFIPFGFLPLSQLIKRRVAHAIITLSLVLTIL